MKKISYIIFLLSILLTNNSYAGRYNVTVERVSNNMYKDLNTGALIKTSLCLELALMDDAILIWGCSFGSEMYGCGKLIFIESGNSCQVDAVY